MTAISGVEFLIWLLIAASSIAVLTKYLRIPYTVALVLGGLLLSLLHLSLLSPLQPNQRPNWLTPDVILILFLPALVFEGSLKIDVRELLRDAAPLLVLANVGVLLATVVTGYLVHWAIGLPILIARYSSGPSFLQPIPFPCLPSSKISKWTSGFQSSLKARAS